MPPGPLPTGTAIRRNKPTIPTTQLPVSGRPGPVPDPPDTYELGSKALDWWGWAWTTPQACAWSDGDLFTVARRAQLEDLTPSAETAQERIAYLRAATDLDDRLGLTPKGLAALRWKIVADEELAGKSGPAPKPKGSRRLKAVG